RIFEPDISGLTRHKSGRPELITPSWLIAATQKVVGFTLSIQGLSPTPPLFEGDVLRVTYSLTNHSPKPAGGDTSGMVSSNTPTYYSFVLTPSGPSPAALPVGAT